MRTRRRPRIAPTALAAGAAVLGMLAVTACGSDDGDDTGTGTLDVVASFYPMAFLAERIGGDHVSVTNLTKPGVEPHDLELGAQQTAELSEADLVVYLGGLQPAVDDAVEQSGVEHVAEATSYTTLERHGSDVDGTEDGTGHEGESESGDGSGSGSGDGLDPHVWLDPVKFAEVAQGVGDAMAEADPDHAADYERNTERLVDDLHELDDEYREGLSDTRTDTFITTHSAFGYLAECYGLHQEAISGLDPESEPSAARMRELHDVAEENDVTTVFFETLASDETADTLAGDLGLTTDVLDPVEGVTDESRGDDYFEIMRANLRALEEALG